MLKKTLRRASGHGFLTRRARKSEPEAGAAISSPGKSTAVLVEHYLLILIIT
ncbi:MAG: hypothetical protein GF417_04780 [Candidatus Latescibacteria bacterium]|nr:hypothetical protein [bacterium]MBD3423735.1 hypothetical protein [Candidatus Latescibacterota bacterium]